MTKGSRKLRMAVLLGLGLICLAAMLLARTSNQRARAQTLLGKVVSSTSADATQTTVQVNRLPPAPAQRKTPPDQPPRRVPRPATEVLRLDPPVDPATHPEDIRPMNAPTEVRILPQVPGETSKRRTAAPQTPGTFTLFRNTGLASAPVVGGATLNAFIPIEPSVAATGRVVFYTTNSYAGISGDGGQTFS